MKMSDVTIERNWNMRTKLKSKLMTGVMVMALPASVWAAQTTAPNADGSQPAQQESASTPPAPQGPFFSQGMMPHQAGMNHGGFPPMGFDPMASRTPGVASDGVVAQAPQAPTYPGHVPGHAYGNQFGNNTSGNVTGSGDIDIQVRGRVGMGGRGAGNGFGNNGWGNNFMNGMPYGQGYGAPYGTPYNQANTAPQYAPQPLPQPIMTEKSTSVAPQAVAPQATQTQTAPVQAAPTYGASHQGGQGYPRPFSWAPQGMNMANPGGFYTQPQTPQAPQAPTVVVAPQQPEQHKEPDWVKEQRAKAEKRLAEAKKRFAEMQRNNPYAQQGYGQPYARGYGQPYGSPYGASYGTPYGYAPQPQLPAAPSGESTK